MLIYTVQALAGNMAETLKSKAPTRSLLFGSVAGQSVVNRLKQLLIRMHRNSAVHSD